MFGVEKRVERVRNALVRTLRSKSMEIMAPHSTKKVEDIPWMDVARGMIYAELAEIIEHLRVEELPEDKA